MLCSNKNYKQINNKSLEWKKNPKEESKSDPDTSEGELEEAKESDQGFKAKSKQSRDEIGKCSDLDWQEEEGKENIFESQIYRPQLVKVSKRNYSKFIKEDRKHLEESKGEIAEICDNWVASPEKQPQLCYTPRMRMDISVLPFDMEPMGKGQSANLQFLARNEEDTQ